MKTKEEWIEFLHELRRNGDFSERWDTFFSDHHSIESNYLADSFIFTCLVALHSSAGDKLAEIMNEDIPEKNSINFVHKRWNASKSPVRNFLLVRHIDFPLPKTEK